MSLSLNAMVTEVHSRIHRTDITNISDWLLEQITFLETLDYWPWRLTRDRTTIALASGTWEYSLPADFGYDLSFRIIEANKVDELDRVALQDFLKSYPDPSQESGGQPTKYSIGYVAATAGTRRLWFPHPADASYTSELIYYNQRGTSTSTTMPTGFTELEKLVLVHMTSAYVEGSILKINDCRNIPTCGCNACQANKWLMAMKNNNMLQKKREKIGWKHPKRTGGIYDVRGPYDIYNV